MNDTIAYYNSKGSNVYVALLGATKAFDGVNYLKLFKKLIERKVSPLVLILLLFMYTTQKLRVKWGSRPVPRGCGVWVVGRTTPPPVAHP